MPEGKRRSISYRSFIICDDPRGVAECRVLRKTMVSSPQKREQNSKIQCVKKQENQNPSLAIVREEKKGLSIGGITREFEASASFQQLGTSNVISYWSSTNEQQNESAKDLLKEALDLQESLVKLKKLQEASSYALGLERKEKRNVEARHFDCMDGRNMDLHQFKNFQDGSSTKSFSEMRRVVRDSLLRQNVTNNPICEEHCEFRKLDSPDMASTKSDQSSLILSSKHFNLRKLSSPDMPSTSSSQSSMIHSSNFASTSSQTKNGNGSNLIVKLMGLESFPSSPRKHRETGRIENLAKPMYDVDSPRARKPQFSVQGTGTKQRTIDEILETLKFKGLLRSNSPKGLTPDSPCSEVSALENRWFYERPPIVIMKPVHFPCLGLDHPSMPKFREDSSAAVLKETLVKLRAKSATPQINVSSSAANSSEKWREDGEADSEVKGKSKKKTSPSKAKASISLHQKLIQEQSSLRKIEVEKVTPTRKGEEKRTPKSSHELRSQDQAKLIKSKVKRKKDGKLISKNQNSCQQKTLSTGMTRETLHSIRGRNQRHKGETKEGVPASKERIDTACEHGSAIPAGANTLTDNSYSEKQEEASEIQITDYDDQSSLSDTREVVSYLHNGKSISIGDARLSTSNEDIYGCRHHPDDDKSSGSDVTSVSVTEPCNVGYLNENHIPIPEVTSITTHENSIAVHLPKVEEGGIYISKDCQPSVSDITPSSAQIKDDMESSTEPAYEARRKCVAPRRKLKRLLLSSPSFVERAEELLDYQVDIGVPHVSDETETDEDPDIATNRLLLDCANEVMELRSFKFSQTCLPLSRMYIISNPRNLSLDQLLEEVCNGIEEQRCYLKPVDVNISSDNLYLLIDQDMKFKNGTWEIGWRNVFSQDDVEKVVGGIDELVLGKLIEEVLVDLVI